MGLETVIYPGLASNSLQGVIVLANIQVRNTKIEDVGKGYRWVNTVQILCTHICTWKMRPVKTILGMRGGVIKKNGGGSEFMYDIFDIRTFVNATMYPRHNNKKRRA
jgi:hypothetical protein